MSAAHTSPARQKLEVETPAARTARLGNLFSSLSSPDGSPAHSANAPLILGDQPGPSRRPKIGDYTGLPPPSASALQRARAFLPGFKEDTEALLRREKEVPGSVGIELDNGEEEGAEDGNDADATEDAVEDVEDVNSEREIKATGKGRVVEFDLGLGVFDVQGDPGGLEGPVIDADGAALLAEPKERKRRRAEDEHEREPDLRGQAGSVSDVSETSDSDSETDTDSDIDTGSEVDSVKSRQARRPSPLVAMKPP